ncbi:MAG: hypothetical protein IJV45_11175 [Prevotella sp.]|nr:hypothetical protein [Prevotella sp.]
MQNHTITTALVSLSMAAMAITSSAQRTVSADYAIAPFAQFVISMDSVRTAIMIGTELEEQLKTSPDGQLSVDVIYLDGHWPVTTGYLRNVLEAIDHVSDYHSGFSALTMKVSQMADMSATADANQLAAIAVALRREAMRYELLLSPDQFAIVWKDLYTIRKRAAQLAPAVDIIFAQTEEILRQDINETIRLTHHDASRHQFLKQTGFTVTKNDKGRWYFAVSGKHYTGDPSLHYLDGHVGEGGELEYHAVHNETDLQPGIYRLTVATRAEGQGPSGAFVFAETTNGNEPNRRLVEIEACDNVGGSIWRDAALRVKEADRKEGNPSPRDVRIALANGGVGYGWNETVVSDIVVMDGRLSYGVSCDPEFTGQTFRKNWFSAVDFRLERIGDL